MFMPVKTKWNVTWVRPESSSVGSFKAAIHTAIAALENAPKTHIALVLSHSDSSSPVSKWSNLTSKQRKEIIAFALKRNASLFFQTDRPWAQDALDWAKQVCVWLRSNQVSNLVIDFGALCPPPVAGNESDSLNQQWLRRVIGILRRANCVKTVGGYLPCNLCSPECDWSSLIQEMSTLDFVMSGEKGKEWFKHKWIEIKEKQIAPPEAPPVSREVCADAVHACEATKAKNDTQTGLKAWGDQLRKILGLLFALLLGVSLLCSMFSPGGGDNAQPGGMLLYQGAVSSSAALWGARVNWTKISAMLLRLCDSQFIPDELCSVFL